MVLTLDNRPVDPVTGRGEILPDAPRCRSNLSCLVTGRCGNRPMCMVEYLIGRDMAFVDNAAHDCGYQFDFGGGHVCSCPVRTALHRMGGSAGLVTA